MSGFAASAGRAKLLLSAGVLATMILGGGMGPRSSVVAAEPKPVRENMPDQEVGVLGDFLVARAVGPLEHMVAVDEAGKPVPPRDGRAAPRSEGDEAEATSEPTTRLRFDFDEGRGARPIDLKRVNLTSTDADVAHIVRLDQFRLDTPGAHNAKIMLGYMDPTWRFTDGDNNDLVHWASRDRVVLFIPVRHGHGSAADDGAAYHISPYGGQTISVVQFKAGDLIRYEWYRDGPKRLHANVLFDLYPHVTGDDTIRPGIDKPIFKFEVYDGGRWKVWIKRDGTDGKIPGPADSEWDMVFTEKSAGARPYTVDIPADKAAFGLSVYSPSADNRKASMTLKVVPYDRETGKLTDPVDRSGPEKRTTVGELRDTRATRDGGAE